MLGIFFVFCSIISFSIAIPIDNGVEGDPEVECGPNAITINFNTQNTFDGHVYVKGRYGEPGCRSDEGGRRVAGIVLPFNACGVSRTRSLNPKGVFVTTTVVVSFHPQFITKIDRAYRIQCFYMEADKTVSTELEVSMLTTGFQTQLVPMPICRYEILENGPTGEPVKFALVGDQVYHKWTCDSETTDTFCMVVHSCFVDDGNGDRVDLLNEDGCAQDKFLLNNLEYPTDLMAGQEAHVFKYADRPQLFFQCQITITVKEPNEACPRPQCPEPPGSSGAARAVAPAVAPAEARGRRTQRSAVEGEITDVRSQELHMLDIDNNANSPSLAPFNANSITSLNNQLSGYGQPVEFRDTHDRFCMSNSGFALLTTLACLLSIIVVCGLAVYILRRHYYTTHSVTLVG